MKIYKFRALSNDNDYSYVEDIIENNRFKCSSFQDLNDPMEGVFSFLMKSNDEKYVKKIDKIFKEILSEKMKFKISCFAGDKEEKRGFNNPAMWGHYANGFKGVAIEVEIKDKDYKKYFKAMNYNDCDFMLNGINGEKEISVDDALIKKVLRHKKMAWKHEDEIRLLVDKNDKIAKEYSGIYFVEIGKINKIYFGDPYGNTDNQDDVYKEGVLRETEKFSEYKKRKEKIINTAEKHKIECFDVEIDKGEVKQLDKNLWKNKQTN